MSSLLVDAVDEGLPVAVRVNATKLEQSFGSLLDPVSVSGSIDVSTSVCHCIATPIASLSRRATVPRVARQPRSLGVAAP